MEAFYKITILVAIVFLILALTVIGILLGKKSNVLVYPPVMNTCPDFWLMDGSNNCIVPNVGCPSPIDDNQIVDCSRNYLNGLGDVNSLTKENTFGFTSTKNADNTTTLKINFQDPQWTGTCQQMSWAMKNNIIWDGVTNYNSC